MEIQRVDSYSDTRFSQKVLYQHGCFLLDEEPYEIEIISRYEAVIRGREVDHYGKIMEEFRFFTPYITRFYDTNGNTLADFPPVTLLTIPLERIQPSQFCVDQEKVSAVSTFLSCSEDIILSVLRDGDRYIALDGHTRLYYAVSQGWSYVQAVEETIDAFIFEFVKEARKRNVYTPYDLPQLSHTEYELKWNKFCDDFFNKEKS